MVNFGIFNRLRHKDSEEDTILQDNIANSAVYTRKQESAADLEGRQSKGIDIDMIDPQEIIKYLEALAYYTRQELVEVTATDKEGNMIYEDTPALDLDGDTIYQDVPIDANGTVLVMKQAVLVKKPVKAKVLANRNYERPWAIAALGYLNKVWPTIWMSPFEADTTKLRIRTAFHDIRKSMSYEEKRRYGIILRMARDLCLARCEDMKDGHKGLLVKVKREDLGVHISRGSGAIGDKK